MKAAARAVLDGLIDYAGLFPPAGLSMPEAVRHFAACQRRDDAWALGRFVVPAARLDEFERALDSLPEADALGGRWPLTALLGTEPRADLDRVLGFNERHVHAGPEVEAVEARVSGRAAVGSIRGIMPSGLELYLELALDSSLPDMIDAVRGAGAYAKMRTGGVRPGEIPSPEAVLRFLQVAAQARVPFKATAGLHHPVRGLARLTYEAGSQCATLHGYLNVILSATVLWHGSPVDVAGRLLGTEGRANLTIGDAAIDWAGITVTAQEIAQARREFALAVGSCSFTEPVEEIGAS